MWIVQVALRRPYTFLVMALLILLATPLVLLKMSVDILPEINVPVISIIWTYGGLSAQEMGQRITANNERFLTTSVSDIEHIESQSLAGLAVIKVFLQPNANVPVAVAQVVAVEQLQLRQLPPGSLPPQVIKYSASSVPIIQLGFVQSHDDRNRHCSTPHSIFCGRSLVTIPGVAIPYPYRRENTAGFGGSRHRGAAREGPVAERCGECDRRAESDPAFRHGENRCNRIRDRPEWFARQHRRAESHSRGDKKWRHHLFVGGGSRS